MQFIIGIITFDCNSSTVNKRIQGERCSKRGDLLDNLSHFCFRQWIIAEFVFIAIIVVENVCPILYQVVFGGIFNNFFFPTAAFQKSNKGILKIIFFIKCCCVVLTHKTPLYKHLFKQCRLDIFELF